ncbi:hypothetical protein ABZ361_18160 [Micromonospora arida]
MAASNGRTKRQRGEIETLPSESLRVKVYAGVDPIGGMKPGAIRTGGAGLARHDDGRPARRAVRTTLAASRPGRRCAELRRSAYLDKHGELREKDTKTHQQRRDTLDPKTIEVLRGMHGRYLDRLAQLDADADSADYIVSPEPDNSRGYRPTSSPGGTVGSPPGWAWTATSTRCAITGLPN